MKKTLLVLFGFALVLVPVLVVKAQMTPIRPSKSDIGYRYGRWRCEGDTKYHREGSANSCKAKTDWQSQAKDYCDNQCDPESEADCGVSKFAVARLCRLTPLQPPTVQSPTVGKLPVTCLNLYKDSIEWGYDTSDKTTGGQVSKLQRFFVAYFKLQDWPLNFNIAGPYGYFGPKTLANLKYFQGNVGGLTATGIVDGPTMAKIAEISKCGVLFVDFTAPLPGATILRGVPFNITVASQNLPTGAKISLTLVSSTTAQTTIVTGQPISSPTFTYSWTVPATSGNYPVLPGGGYKIKGDITDANGSPLFTDEVGYLILASTTL